MDYSAIVKEIISQYKLPLFGRHGLSHWARVWEGGLKLASETGADQEVVRLFALFHDARRENERRDDGHGKRGAELLTRFRGELVILTDHQFDMLFYACVHHTDGMTEGDVTVQTCWDSDRLDLGRIGVRPNPRFLCTDAAKEASMISWSMERSRILYAPPLIQTEWGIASPIYEKNSPFP